MDEKLADKIAEKESNQKSISFYIILISGKQGVK